MDTMVAPPKIQTSKAACIVPEDHWMPQAAASSMTTHRDPQATEVRISSIEEQQVSSPVRQHLPITAWHSHYQCHQVKRLDLLLVNHRMATTRTNRRSMVRRRCKVPR